MCRIITFRRSAAVCAALVAISGLAGCASTHPAASSSTVGSIRPGTAHATIGDLTLTGGYIPQPASPDVAAAYVTVANSGSVADTVTKVTTNVTTDVMAMTEISSGGVGTMRVLSSVTVPAHGSISLTPGHAHLMLENPTRTLKQGDTVSLTITFAKAGTVTLAMPVVALTGPVISSGNMSGLPGMGGG